MCCEMPEFEFRSILFVFGDLLEHITRASSGSHIMRILLARFFSLLAAVVVVQKPPYGSDLMVCNGMFSDKCCSWLWQNVWYTKVTEVPDNHPLNTDHFLVAIESTVLEIHEREALNITTLIIQCVDTRTQQELNRLNDSILSRLLRRMRLFVQEDLSPRRAEPMDYEFPATVGTWRYYCYDGKVETYTTFSVTGRSLRKCSCKRTEEVKEWLRPNGDLCVRSRPSGRLSRIRAKLSRQSSSNRITSYMTISEINEVQGGTATRDLMYTESDVAVYDWASAHIPDQVQACTNPASDERLFSLQLGYVLEGLA